VHAAYRSPVALRGWRSWKAKYAHSQARAAERRALSHARLVVCNSRRTARDVIERVRVPEDRVKVVYYGCDAKKLTVATSAERRAAREALGWPHDRPIVAFVGALGDRRKGFDTLFEAWRRLCALKSWDADLAVAGAGAELDAWRQRAHGAGLGERIKFLGFRKDVDRILAACDGLVHPARYEAYGLSVQEALCRGLPAIVSASAGVAEMYPAELEPLTLADPESAAELVEKLKSWRSRLEEFAALVAPVANRLRERSWADMAADFVAATGAE
jgi:glycosyltransferase involved in cell wall biosynthesis